MHSVNKNYVTKSPLKNMDATDHELMVASGMANSSRPFALKLVPVNSDHTGHSIMSAPVIMFTQATLNQLSLHLSIRHIAPSARVNSTSSRLQVSWQPL